MHGIRVCSGAPPSSHLLFADDSFLFLRATEREAEVMKNILHTYELAFGQAINLAKYEILFSKNVHADQCQILSTLLGVQERTGRGMYLGLPSLIGRNKKETFTYVKDRIWKRINSWKGKTLSMAGREILLKSVAQAIPSYCMSMYLIPESLGEEIQCMLNSFWWDTKRRELRGINWLSWEKLTMPKKFGGMAFRDLYAFNLAMLGKQGWRLVTEPNVLVTRLFKAKIFSTYWVS